MKNIPIVLLNVIMVSMVMGAPSPATLERHQLSDHDPHRVKREAKHLSYPAMNKMAKQDAAEAQLFGDWFGYEEEPAEPTRKPDPPPTQLTDPSKPGFIAFYSLEHTYEIIVG